MATILRSSGVHLPVLCSSFPSPRFHSLRSPSRSVQTLAYEEIRTSNKPFDSTALVIHGVLGSSQYLKPFSGELLSELQKSSCSNGDMKTLHLFFLFFYLHYFTVCVIVLTVVDWRFTAFIASMSIFVSMDLGHVDSMWISECWICFL